MYMHEKVNFEKFTGDQNVRFSIHTVQHKKMLVAIYLDFVIVQLQPK